MTFKRGDQVKFIDQIGEAKVKDVLDSGLILIEDDNGFEYQVSSKEILLKDLNSEKAYKTHAPSDSSIFQKDVDHKKLQKAENKFKDLYKEKLTIKKNEVMEVDLHIHELLDSTKGMMNGDMLQYQINHFERMMKIAERKKISKIVFIHGVGEGVLRREIVRIIGEFYPNCSSQDADYRLYGYGATEVRIRFN